MVVGPFRQSMKAIALPMVLLMLTATLAGCTGGDPDGGDGADGIDAETLQNLQDFINGSGVGSASTMQMFTVSWSLEDFVGDPGDRILTTVYLHRNHPTGRMAVAVMALGVGATIRFYSRGLTTAMSLSSG